jgi:hypothetical protein
MYTTKIGREGDFARDITKHASLRMVARSLGIEAVEAALEFGRIVHIRGAAVHALGRKEVERFGRHGIDLSAHEGVQVVCSPDGAVVTVYRNRDFRGLRSRRHSGRTSRRTVQ